MTAEKRRQYHLGLDWGTSATKLVLRDYEQRKAFVLYLGASLKYRYPSTIAKVDGNIYFGFEAEKQRNWSNEVYDSVKASIYSNSSHSQNPTKEEDLATLYLAHVIGRALDFAEMHAARGKAKAVMGVTLGIPAEELDQAEHRHVYVRIARTAYDIAIRLGFDPQGEAYSDCMQALKAARKQLKEKDKASPPDPLRFAQWLRPEMAAAMYWGIKSPTIQCDLYSCVDIGAWTTNASFFRLHSNNGTDKGGIAFYGGACRPPGMIELLKSVSKEMGIEYTGLYGQEHLLRLEKYLPHIEKFKPQYFSVWQEGFRRSYQKEMRQNAWDGKLNLMVVGGGSKIDSVRQHLESEFPHKGWAPPIVVPDLGVPTDLFEFPRSGIIPRQSFVGDVTFLLVAYGLSVHSRDFPKTTLSPQVDPIKPMVRSKNFIPFDELGFDK